MSSQSPPPGTFHQRLGLFDATMLVAGTMIGSGIFIVSADIMRDVGCAGSLLLIWLVTGFMTVMGALSYAELAAMMPRAGGQYVYLKESFSPLWGFLYGWSVFLIIQTGSIAAVAVAFAKFLGVIVPSLGTGEEAVLWRYSGLDLKLSLPLPWLAEPLVIFKRSEFAISSGQLIAVGVIVLLTWVNCKGIRQGKLIQNLFTIAKTFALFVLIVLGLTIGANSESIRTNLNDFWTGMTATNQFNNVSELCKGPAWLVVIMVAGGAMVGSLFSADAWNNVTFTAGEMKNPVKTLPWSLLLGTGLVIALYILVNLAYLAVLPARGSPLVSAQLKADIAEERAIVNEYQAEMSHFRATANRLEKESERMSAQAAALRSAGENKRSDSLVSEASARLVEAKTWNSRAEKAQEDLAESSFRAQKSIEIRINRSTKDLGISHARDDRVGTAVLQYLSPNFGMAAMAIAIMISTFGCVNGMILMGARLYYAMAHDGLFFKSAGLLNANGVPAAGLILQSAWSILLVFSGTYIELLDYVIFAALLFYALTVTGLFVLRKKQPNTPRPYKAWGYPWLPGIYIFFCSAIMVDLLIVRPEYTWPGLILVAGGIPVYFFWKTKNRFPNENPASPNPSAGNPN